MGDKKGGRAKEGNRVMDTTGNRWWEERKRDGLQHRRATAMIIGYRTIYRSILCYTSSIVQWTGKWLMRESDR